METPSILKRLSISFVPARSLSGRCDVCKECKQAAIDKHHGGCLMQCLACCARLVISARPSKRFQEAMLAAIAMQKGAPTRAQILEHIKGLKND